MPGLRWRLLHVLALATLAITQPLLALLGENPTFFTAHDAGPTRIVWFAVVVAVVPAAVLGAIVAVAHHLGRVVGARVHLTVLGLLGFVFLIQIVDLVGGPWIIPVVLATVGAGGIVVVYREFESARSALTVLGVTPVLFVAMFLFVSPTSDLVLPADVDAVALADLVDATILTDASGTAVDVVAPPTVRERLAERFPSIYLLVLDELPTATLLDEHGRVDRDRFPNLAALADTADLFTNATTVGFTTERAVPAILTGRYATALAPVYSRYPENLYTLLGDIYDATESDPLIDLCPSSICDGHPPPSVVELLDAEADAADAEPTSPSPGADRPIPAPATDRGAFGRLLTDARIVFGHLVAPDGLDLGLPEIGATWGDFGADLTPDRATTTATTTSTSLDLTVGALPDDDDPVPAEEINGENQAFLDGLTTNDTRLRDFASELARVGPSETPRLHVLHLLFPHVPWRLHANGQTYDDIRTPGYFDAWDDDPDIAVAALQRHLLQTVATDRLVGDYVDRLVEVGVFDDSIVIVTADHGIGFVPGERARGVGAAGAGIAGVPIFVKAPGQRRGATLDHAVETVDIVPTIASLLDIDLPWAVDGHDLFGPEAPRRREVLHPFRITVPDPFPPARDEVTAEIRAIFGTGAEGDLYARAGLHDRIGTGIADLVVEPSPHCWVLERPAAVPESDGTVGHVFGEVRSSRSEAIPLALTVNGVLTGTSVTFRHEVPHRVYALGDPTLFAGATVDDIVLHEIVGDTLRPLRRC